jgi:hypothetical protein
MRFEEKIHQQRIDLRSVAIDLVILRRMASRHALAVLRYPMKSRGRYEKPDR